MTYSRLLWVYAIVFVLLTTHTIHLPSLMLAVSDEYTFISVLVKMKSALLAGNLPQIFSYSFFNYGFAYFFGLLILTLPAILIGKWAWVIIIPRAISGISALCSAFLIISILSERPKSIQKLALLGLATMPGFWIYGSWFHPDWVMTCAILASILALKKDHWHLKKNYWLGALWMGVAVGIKFQALTFVPLLGLYLIQAKQHPYWQRFKSGILGIGITFGTFLVINPYIIHPEGRIAFLRALKINLISNSTNHSLGGVLSLQEKFHGAIGTYFFRPELAIPILIIVFAIGCRFFLLQKKTPELMDIVALITTINLSYLLVMVNKDWGHYYITPMILAWVVVTDTIGRFPEQVHPKHRQKASTLVVLTLTFGLIWNSLSTIPTLYTHWKNTAYQDALRTGTPITKTITDILSTKTTAQSTILTNVSTIIDWDTLQIPFESVHRIYGPLRQDHFEETAYYKRFKDMGVTHTSPFIPKEWIILKTSELVLEKYKDHTDLNDYKEALRLVDTLKNGKWGYTLVYQSNDLLIFRRTNSTKATL